jgi:predicted nucleotidyltransferase
VLDKFTIVRTLQAESDRLKREFHIQKLGLFGSFSRNQQTEKSDIDFIIELEPGVDNIFETKQHLREYLTKLFSRNIDLAHYKYLKPYAKKEVLGEVEPIV